MESHRRGQRAVSGLLGVADECRTRERWDTEATAHSSLRHCSLGAKRVRTPRLRRSSDRVRSLDRSSLQPLRFLPNFLRSRILILDRALRAPSVPASFGRRRGLTTSSRRNPWGLYADPGTWLGRWRPRLRRTDWTTAPSPVGRGMYLRARDQGRDAQGRGKSAPGFVGVKLGVDPRRVRLFFRRLRSGIGLLVGESLRERNVPLWERGRVHVEETYEVFLRAREEKVAGEEGAGVECEPDGGLEESWGFGQPVRRARLVRFVEGGVRTDMTAARRRGARRDETISRPRGRRKEGTLCRRRRIVASAMSRQPVSGTMLSTSYTCHRSWWRLFSGKHQRGRGRTSAQSIRSCSSSGICVIPIRRPVSLKKTNQACSSRGDSSRHSKAFAQTAGSRMNVERVSAEDLSFGSEAG